jgi:hypothetical protein
MITVGQTNEGDRVALIVHPDGHTTTTVTLEPVYARHLAQQLIAEADYIDEQVE